MKVNLFILLLTILFAENLFAKEINIYSHRQPFLINPFLEAFTSETGIKTNVIYSKKGLAQRLKAEGENSPADVILTVDIGRLYIYEDLELLASIKSTKLISNIPSHLRSSKNTWFGLSKRARVIIVDKNRVKNGEIKRIEDLANQKWEGRICSRPGSHVYNRALMASIIAAHGNIEAEKWANKFVNNLARKPQGNDRAQVKAIYEGECDIAIINNYYFGKLKFSEDPEQKKWIKNLRLIFPNQEDGDRGSHINISGGGIAKFSKNKNEAIALLEFLTSEKAQKLYGEINFEYPVNPNIATTSELKSWGVFKEDQLPIIKIAELAPVAQKIIDRVGW
ncbi:MAG: Iron uptake protein A1 [Alphaproteobacteria bacterium MarineAlpha5_Bin11]|nr:iron ABC transporter substrate-binding protein [Pelagibacteraceae bacterium]PPR42382.1 MAG: Iron uptake protein A1 [Alphaproteobacteria bacterium MarineAlpha5_Bin11]PPR51993.1 MAG: Iron uptake protein A1 [Alphaproteobacteria bacterium MarineAlpha5_Bin10]|tara:strand:+ start:35804 stop:36814 length:1011 start_codon:yes stop_codon:yes gene_type:complete